MNSSGATPRMLGRAGWIRRCAARIRSLDDVVTLIDAADLATTLCDLPCCQGLAPDAAAARLFQDNLTPSQWNNDLSTLCPAPHRPPRDDASGDRSGAAGTPG